MATSNRDAELRRNWTGLAASAKAHEDVHMKIAEAFARTRERSFLAIPPQPSCGRFEAIALAQLRNAVPLRKRAQLAFDAPEQKRFARLAAQVERGKR